MNYTLRKLNCKVLLGVIFCAIFIRASVQFAYAYDRVYVYSSGDFGMSGGFVAELANVKRTYVLDVGPRDVGELHSVIISYDSLADLVYYCNEHGLSTTLTYNYANSVYLAYVSDKEFKITAAKKVDVRGCLGNSDGYVYVAEKPEAGGDTINNNTYNFNQTIINNHTVGSGGTISNPYISSSWSDRVVQEKILEQVDYIEQRLAIANGYLSNLGWIAIDIRDTIQDNVVPALEVVNSNIISFKDSTVTGLNNLHKDLTFNGDVLLTQLNVQNAIYSSVAGLGSRLDTLVTNSAGIGSRLDSIITNGAVQVNTSSIDARLDKLISMYSKVNSVVLDTAAVNGGQITGAVGGALQDVMIYGRTRRENSQLTTTLPGLSVNGTPFVLGNTPLRSVHFTASVPAYITNDADLAAGVWKAGTYNYVSDTYNASTGEYVQRINVITLTGEETWSMAARAGSSSIFYTPFTGSNLRAECNLFNYIVPSTDFTQASANVDALGAAFTIYSNALRFVSPVTSVDAWKTYLKNRVAEGNPVTVFWVPDPATDGTGTVSSWYADAATISIPEGDSTITADGLRVTAKYETYESYTKTADIIAAIDRLQLGVAPDLDPIVSRLDTLISQSSDTVVNVVTNNTYITSVYQLDDENDVADRSKEGIEKIGGVFKWLWKHAFKDAFGAADITKLDGLL